ILKRNYFILTPEAQAADVQADLDTLPEAIAASVTFNIVEGLGPEVEPGAGVSAVVTHRLDGPYHDDDLFTAVRAHCATAWPDVYVHDTSWRVLDDGVERVVIPDHPDPRDTLNLFQHDPVW